MHRIIFVSSVQEELAKERQAIRDFIHSNRLLAKHFKVFLFEDLPAKDRRPDQLYLEKVDECAVFVSLLAAEYGWEDPLDGVSPTEREFDHATQAGKYRLLFIRNLSSGNQHPKMAALIDRARQQLKYQRFDNVTDLTSSIYESLVELLEEWGVIQSKPFDAAVCPGLTLDDMDSKKIDWFVNTARRERNFRLTTGVTAADFLTHLNLVDKGGLTNAAAMLFARDPQHFRTSALVKCAHYHGNEVVKPVPSHQVFGGSLFDQVDNAVDFVLSKVNRQVGTRAESPSAPVAYELPKEAVAELIVNAVAHRDYTSNASVQVSIFSDRIEVWNPGRLPAGLTPSDLARPHSSEPANPLIAHPLYLAHYIESLGTGTLDIIRLCRESGLPVPDFEQRGGQFVVTVWRDWLTEAIMDELGLNERQKQALAFVKLEGRISNSEYQRVADCSKKTATRDLTNLKTGILKQVGTSGPGVHYLLRSREDILGTLES